MKFIESDKVTMAVDESPLVGSGRDKRTLDIFDCA